jgi:hypothetical protein
MKIRAKKTAYLIIGYRPCVPFKNTMRIVLTEVIQPDGTLTREWHGEICADDPLPYAQWITDSLGYEVAVLANGQPIDYSERQVVNMRIRINEPS